MKRSKSRRQGRRSARPTKIPGTPASVPPHRPRSRWGTALAIAASILLLLGLLEIIARLAGLGAPEDTVDLTRGFLPFQSVFRATINDRGERRLVTNDAREPLMQRPQFNPQSLPADKPRGEFRILCLGGSVTYGWPFDDRLSYPRLLEIGLTAAAPATDWRVVNLGAPGWGTTRLRLIADELARLDPDLVIITSGNNEVLETAFRHEVLARGGKTLEWVAALARHSRLVAFVASAAARGSASQATRGGEDASDDGLGGLLETASARGELVDAYAANLTAMAETFRTAGARVYLSTVPVNLRDCPPIGKDGPGEPLGSRDPELLERYRDGWRLLAEGRPRQALERIDRALERQPESARLHYLRGRLLDAAERRDEARSAFATALDLDPVALRAFGALNRTVRTVASTQGARLVDFVAAMATASRMSAPGYDLFLDNCHPNSNGIRVLAFEVARAMASDGLLAGGDAWSERFLAAIDRHLADVTVPPKLQATALRFLLWYHEAVSPSPARADSLRREVGRLRARER